MNRFRMAAIALAALLVAGCGGVRIQPDKGLPTALVKPLPAHAGLVISGELRNYSHKETRTGSDWQVDLGPGHVHLLNDMFKASFTSFEVFKDLDAARAASGIAAIFEPKIEQFSFATARDTGGRYWAVTIRYRLEVYTPQGERADSLTLSGYGSTLAGRSGADALERASLAAMRDAASKFLVQMPRQPMSVALAKGEPVSPAAPVSAANSSGGIEAVPIEADDDEPGKPLPII
ncbi:MAG: hypothetical protein ABIT36_02385 [Steroidobacteraceae bacterium]